MSNKKKKKDSILKEKVFSSLGEDVCLKTFYGSSRELDQRAYRLYEATNCRDAEQLASFLEVEISAVHEIEKGGEIPAEWLLFVLRMKDIHPDWILTGRGPRFIKREGLGLFERPETQLSVLEKQKALKSLSSYALAEELLRRMSGGGGSTGCP